MTDKALIQALNRLIDDVDRELNLIDAADDNRDNTTFIQETLDGIFNELQGCLMDLPGRDEFKVTR